MPLSDDPAARSNQLANLRRGGAVTPKGEPSTRLSHGGRSALLFKDVSDEVMELTEALADAAPVKDPDGSVPAADGVMLETAARALKRFRHLAQWLDLHGRLDPKTSEPRPAAELELKAERSLTMALDSLGMTPTARARLGLDLARAAEATEDAEATRAARERLDSRAKTIDVSSEEAGED